MKQSDKTIFYSSHIMDGVEKISDRIVILNKGKAIAVGTFSELSEQAGGSLEHIFTTLTGNNAHQSTAGQFINILEN